MPKSVECILNEFILCCKLMECILQRLKLLECIFYDALK